MEYEIEAYCKVLFQVCFHVKVQVQVVLGFNVLFVHDATRIICFTSRWGTLPHTHICYAIGYINFMRRSSHRMLSSINC